MRLTYLYILIATFALTACTGKKSMETTPWGEPADGQTETDTRTFSLTDIQENGELIMLTVSGPDTYFDYHGKGMGTQYMLCEKFAQHIGVSLRVEVCKDTTEMLRRLEKGEGDIIACQIREDKKQPLRYCGYAVDSLHTSWAVAPDNTALADSLDRWYTPQLMAQVIREEKYLFSAKSIRRHTYAPMLSASSGVISRYDHLFQKYAPLARWDWRLMAAQCYQESTFDPNAQSWAGACGLMQIMPSTARSLGLSMSEIYDPEANIAASAKYISILNEKFRDVPNAMERSLFVLASYNGGFFHIRDAMALARKYGRNAYRWTDVSEFVLRLSDPQYYQDPVVKYGYMRGTETAGYVERIRDRWAQYRGVAKGGGSFPSGFGSSMTPRKAHGKNRYGL